MGVFVVILLVGLLHVGVLLLYVPASFVAVAVFAAGNESQRWPVLLAWVPAVLTFLAIPVACFVALGALSADVLDERSLLAPVAIAVWFAAVLLARGISALDRRRHPEPVDRRVVPPDPAVAPLDPRTLEELALAAPVTDPPDPWCAHGPVPLRDVHGLGFADDPETGRELMLVVSPRGRDLFETLRGTHVAHDPATDDALCRPRTVSVGGGAANVEHHCPGLGPLEGMSVRMVGFGVGPLLPESRKWSIDIVTGPSRGRVVLGHAGGLHRADADWWAVRETVTPLRAAGFSASGRTLVVVTDGALWWAARSWQARPGFGR